MISVIIPLDRPPIKLEACLNSLSNQVNLSEPCEVIVIGRDEHPEGRAIIERMGHRFICQSGSPAEAKNAGVSQARGEIVCFTDPDCVPAETWVAAISGPIASREAVGTKGVYATRQGKLTARFIQLEYEDRYDRMRHAPQIDFVDTYSAAYDRDVLIANGGFDARFPRLEDQELSYRLSVRGYRLLFQADALVYHHHMETPASYFANKYGIGYWKAQVIRRFPQRGWQDSHTPQVVKLQMALAGLFALSLVIALLSLLLPQLAARTALLLPLGTLLLFLATTLPFTLKS